MSGCLRVLDALKKLPSRDLEGRESKFSQPAGRPNSTDGKGSETKWMGSLASCIRSAVGFMRDKFAGVVMKEIVMPR